MVPPLIGAEQDLPARGLHHSGGELHRVAADLERHLLQGEAMASQGLLGDLDRYLAVPYTSQLDLSDLLTLQEAIPQGLAQLPKGPLLGVTVDGDLDHLAPVRHQRDGRALRVLWKRLDAIDAVLDVGERPLWLRRGLQLHIDGPVALPRGRDHLLDAIETADLLLDGEDDALLCLRWAGTRVPDAHDDPVHVELGEDLFLDLQPHHDAAEHEDGHQDVGRDAIGRHPRDRPTTRKERVRIAHLCWGALRHGWFVSSAAV